MLLQTIDKPAAFDLHIGYRRTPESPLTKDDVVWADRLLRQSSLRLGN